MAFFVGTAFSILMFGLRRSDVSLETAWLAFGVALVGAGLLAWWRARPGFYRPHEARVMLESRLRLDARLTAADLGLVPWPPIPEPMPAIVTWRPGAPAAWLGGAAALLAIATFAPVPADAGGSRLAGSPPALLQTEAMLAALREMDVAEPQAIETLESRARELARRPSDEQYSHSALEAADALRNQTAVSAAALGRGLDAAAQALRSGDTSADMKESAGQLAAALSGLREGALPANKALLANLPGSGADLKNLSAEQRAQLARQLAQAASGLKGVAGAAGMGANVAQPDGAGMCLGTGTEPGGDSAPLMLAANASDAGDGENEGISGEALKRFTLGDRLGTTSGGHDNDPSRESSPTAAGAIGGAGAGGEAAWVNRLTPTERAALKHFFK